ncbi:metallophosphoesterase [Leisingera sp. HS039]|uniref:metallophosphoesterase family protein n=1 Tax=unclassified Leisingera TaxID=2614906 RepID=UPI001070F387|nr:MULTISPECIES: metallophosphoesterase [unclassified Leisingera]MBQ4825756.1 metallophosphoesterase [Leisingera sp. HS039]QBR37266.1 serine/threonine protein phosphatase [Leisingera sp. NJS201]
MAGHLGAKLGCFAVISDTHVNPEEDRCNSPFPVNKRANRRFRHVIRDLNQQPIDFVVHTGDLVHPVPEAGPAYSQAAEVYRSITTELTVPIHELPGNHDIGDTPISGAPASPTTDGMIKAWTQEFGAQYQAFEAYGIKFLLLNAQLINSGLPNEAAQKDWLEAELKGVSGQRVMLFLHHPPYLMQPEERDHYDNTNQPGRAWLLDLVQQHGVEAMFAGHAHNFWYDRFGQTDYYMAPATSFVRQDYSEMLRAAPSDDSEFGRDDKAKLGYFLVTVYENGHTVRMIRTFGAEAGEQDKSSAPQPRAPDPRTPSRPVLGFDLRQNWAEVTEVPPSGGLDEFDRKLVRNDYPLLALQEMGVRHVRIPLADLADPERRKRLPLLQHLGFRITLFSYGLGDTEARRLTARHAHCLQDWEVTIDWPDFTGILPALLEMKERTRLPIYLSRIRTKADLQSAGTYFHVINHGFSATDIPQLNEIAANGLDGAVFRLGCQEAPAKTLQDADAAAGSCGLKASVHMRMGHDNPALPAEDEDASAKRLSEAMQTAARLLHCRLVCDTLVSVDRGYFPRVGMIDRYCNPTRLLEVVKSEHANLASAKRQSV